MRDLKNIERAHFSSGSHQMTDALVIANKDVTRHNFYTQKMDAAAWNDFGANPRPADFVDRRVRPSAPYTIGEASAFFCSLPLHPPHACCHGGWRRIPAGPPVSNRRSIIVSCDRRG